MSLINDALKKAQKQRDEGNQPPAEISSPATSAEPLQRVARREKPVGFRSQLLLIAGGGVAVLVLLGGGALFFLRSSDQTPVTAKQPTQVASAPTAAPTASVTPVTQPAAPKPAALVASTPVVTPTVSLPPASQAPATSTPLPVQPLAVAAAPTVSPAATPAPTPVTPAAAPIQFVIQTPPAAVGTPEVTPSVTPITPSAPPKASTRMIGLIEHYRVGGIRVSGTESKVLMNDKVYRLNDTVDYELGIRLTGIAAKALTFEDAHGSVYTRNF